MNTWPSVKIRVHNQCKKINNLEMVHNIIANKMRLFVSIFLISMWF